jgi:hypothetical protein
MRMSSRAGRLAGALAAPLLLAGVLGGLGAAQASAAAAGCQAWTGTQPPSLGTDDQLAGVTVLSACDAWAVGSFTDASNVQDTLIEHWDGSNWTVFPSPNPGDDTNFLDGVRAASPTNIWAVGAYSSESSTQQKSLVLHWDGAQWTQQNSPSPGSESNTLTGVRPVTAGEAWAVGISSDGKTDRALVLHFTAGKWRRVEVPGVSIDDELTAVAATSPKDVWAVGLAGVLHQEAQRAGQAPGRWLGPLAKAAGTITVRTLILHWNGKTWSVVPSPSPGDGAAIAAVGAISPTSALAVGAEVQGKTVRTLALRWNGKTWTRVPSPSPGPSGSMDILNGVTLTSQGSAWAVGGTSTGMVATSRSLIEHWNGRQWTTVRAPDPGLPSDLLGISASSGSSAWAVGLMAGPTTNQVFAVHCC